MRYIKLAYNKGSDRKSKLIYIFATIITVAILIVIFLTSSVIKTFSVFNINPDKSNISISSNLDSIHLDNNIDTKNIQSDSFINSNFAFIDLPANPLSSLNRLNIDAEFAITSGVSQVKVYIDHPLSNNELIYSRFLENLDWPLSHDPQGISFWQKNKEYSKLEDIFISDSNIQKQALQINTQIVPDVRLKNYQSSASIKSIFFPVRGDFNSAFYLGKNENLYLKLYKRDLNLYEGEDKVSVKLLNYKKEPVKEYTIDDDGVTFQNPIADSFKELTINEKDLSEGMYFLQVSQDDSIIEKFDTNLTKFVFMDNLFIANNPSYTPNAESLTFSASASTISASPVHDFAFQDLEYNNSKIALNAVNVPVIIKAENANNLTEFKSNLGDIFLRADGYFAFDDSYLFNPKPVITTNYDGVSLENNFDIILARYTLLQKENGYYKKNFSIEIPNDLIGKSIRLVIETTKSSKKEGVILKKIDFKY
jgi:hypothetical protein